MSRFPLPAFEHYFTMWNETDVSLVRGHLDQAVTEDFVFCDPLHHHVGRDALEENVREFRHQYPHAQISVSSGFDSHHDRYRYTWKITVRGKVFVTGFDAVRVDENGRLARIDGFFGPLPEPTVET
jgi:hypothetical protein